MKHFVEVNIKEEARTQSLVEWERKEAAKAVSGFGLFAALSLNDVRFR